ncbi:MAG TPA: carboxypeptidase-like regulatory domain-containing protein [Polyangia bacterium]|nr:carboxypeptidase-like regulatory domain-containing protein [Polyangia bacterium]
MTGTVYAPNGTLPIYNAIVYVPSQATASFTDGVTCGACDGQVSGAPVVTTLTGADGTFTLANVPPGAQIPLVIQIGKWRKQTTINVPACASTAVAAGDTTLPKSSSVGDMPKMAIATGSVDPFECLLLKIGIDPAEIQPDSANTRIAFFTATHSPGTTMAGATAATSLYASLAKLLDYDIVILPCEGGEYDQSTGAGGKGGGAPLSPDPRGLMAQYVNMGGRLFTTHYSYDWLTYTGSPFNAISKTLVGGLWDKDQSDYPQSDTTTTVAQLVTNFPKGMAFAQWLIAAGAMSAMNTLDIQAIRHDIDDVDPALAQSWATDTMTDGKAGIAHLTFNTPLDPASTIDNPGLYCGRVVFSDFHVASNEVTGGGKGGGGGTFPGACVGGAMTDQEKALAFMLFDLSSCVQPDQNPPVPPIS